MTDIFSHCMLEPCLRCWPCTQCHSLHKREPFWLRCMPLTMQPLLSLSLTSLNTHQEIDTSEYWLWGYFPGRAIGKRQGRKSASRTFSIDEEILVVQIVAGYACNSPYGIRKASLNRDICIYLFCERAENASSLVRVGSVPSQETCESGAIFRLSSGQANQVPLLSLTKSLRDT